MKRLARGSAALLILAALLIGAPVALVAWAGNPWPPGGLSEVQLLTSRAVAGLIAIIAWAAWVQLSACVLVEIMATIRASTPDGSSSPPGDSSSSREPSSPRWPH